MRIGDREIGTGAPVYVIAEIGVNHDGDAARAVELTRLAAKAGADAVKFQYFEADRLMSKAAKLAAYQRAAGETDPLEMLRRLELSLDDLAACAAEAHRLGVHAIVSVFSVEHVAPTAAIAWDAFKSASPDIVNRPLLEALASTGRPLVVSTGASTLEEVREGVSWLADASGRLAVMQCVSSYPTRFEDAEFGGVLALREALGLPTGYSDHTPDAGESALAAVAHGACVLEKHMTYDRRAPGPDHRASLEPEAFGAYCAAARRRGGDGPSDTIELQPARKRVLVCEEDVRRVSRQSLTTTRALRAGHVLTGADLTVKRPGTGVPARDLRGTIGRSLARDVDADTPLSPDDLAPVAGPRPGA
ncbi:MAG: N-acetylneuraminate synthase family protein [Planctomycetota bacterium]|nr:N-acetylneuraminate synthase family protein [Planctomycetota bacterium]